MALIPDFSVVEILFGTVIFLRSEFLFESYFYENTLETVGITWNFLTSTDSLLLSEISLNREFKGLSKNRLFYFKVMLMSGNALLT